MFGAGRVIAIDRVPERLAMAREHGKAETIDFDREDVYEVLQEKTKGRGPTDVSTRSAARPTGGVAWTR